MSLSKGLVGNVSKSLASGLTSTNEGGGGPPVASGDWADYDGTNDGTTYTFDTAGESARISAVTAVDNDRFINLYTDEATDPDETKAVLGVRTNKVLASADVLGLPNMNGAGALQAYRLSDTRALMLGSTGNTVYASLVGISSEFDEFTGELDDASLASHGISNADVADANTLFLAYRTNSNATGEVGVLTTGSDTLTFGNSVDFTGGTGDAAATAAVCALSPTSGFAVFDRFISYFTVSGTTVTRQAITAYNGGTPSNEARLVRISATEAILYYLVDAAAGPIRARYVKYDGSWTFGTAIEVNSDFYNNKNRNYSVALGNRRGAFAVKRDGGSDVLISIILADADGTLTVEAEEVKNPAGIATQNVTLSVIPTELDGGVTQALYLQYSDQETTNSSYTQVLVNNDYTISAGGGKGENPAGGPITDITNVSAGALDLSATTDESYSGTGPTWTDIGGDNNFDVSDYSYSAGFVQATGDYMRNDTPSGVVANLGKYENNSFQWVSAKILFQTSAQTSQTIMDNRRTSNASGSANDGARFIIQNNNRILLGNRNSGGSGSIIQDLGFTLTDNTVYEIYMANVISSGGAVQGKFAIVEEGGTITVADTTTQNTWGSGTDPSTYAQIGVAFNRNTSTELEDGTVIYQVQADYTTGTTISDADLQTLWRAVQTKYNAR